MDYEEKLRLAKEALESGSYDRETIEYIFPELRKSEDEKIRKEMIFYFQQEIPQCSIQEHADKMKEFIVWLEKQGNKTSWKPSKEEMDVLYGLAYITNQYDEHKEEVITRLYQDLKREFFNGSSYENMFPNTEDGVRRRNTIQVLEPAWSKDDETALCDALWCCKQARTIAKDENDMGNIWYAETWLKSIKERMKGE